MPLIYHQCHRVSTALSPDFGYTASSLHITQHGNVALLQVSSVLPPLSSSPSLWSPLRHSCHQTLLPLTPDPGREILPLHSWMSLSISFAVKVGFWQKSQHHNTVVPGVHPSTPATNFRAARLFTRPPCSHPMEQAVSSCTALHSVVSKQFKIVTWNKVMKGSWTQRSFVTRPTYLVTPLTTALASSSSLSSSTSAVPSTTLSVSRRLALLPVKKMNSYSILLSNPPLPMKHFKGVIFM